LVNIRAPYAWNIWTGDPSFRIAVFDSGIDLGTGDFPDEDPHPALANNLWVNALESSGTTGVDDDGNGYIDDIHGYDFVDGEGDPRHTDAAPAPHGTQVAGIIGGFGNNSIGVAGLNWVCKIVPLKIMYVGYGEWSNAIAAIEYMRDNGIKLANVSWSCREIECLNSSGLCTTISNAQADGLLFVVAAHNQGQNLDDHPVYPAACSADNIITVAATTELDGLKNNSNFSQTKVDLGAPGNISQVFSASRDTSTGAHTYNAFKDTSAATAHVTGVAGLVWSLHPSWTWEQVRDQVLKTVRKTPRLAGFTVTAGIVDDSGALGDCNLNGIDDATDIAEETSADLNNNDFPDECEDCDEDGVPDSIDTSPDCNDNGLPDSCDIAYGASWDCEPDGVPQQCQPLGACCKPNPSCVDITECACYSFGGTWRPFPYKCGTFQCLEIILP